MKMYEEPQVEVIGLSQSEEIAFGDMQLPLSALVPNM